MKLRFLFIALIFFAFCGGEETQADICEDYVRDVNYQMDIYMDVSDFTFSGEQELVYTNNSPDTINKVYYHLFFNAFKPNSQMDIRSRTIRDPDRRVGSRILALEEKDYGDLSVKSLKQDGKDIYFEEDDVMGLVEILPTPSGNILKELFKNGISVGISSRGMGSLKPGQNGVQEVQDDFELLCFDFVSTPSTPGAYMHTIKEGLDFSYLVIDEYNKINEVITEILCNNGQCQ